MQTGQEPVEDFAARARDWVAANLPPRVRGQRPEDPHTPAHIARHRQLQRTLFDGGFAGITWPGEYGGQGLTAAHDAAFKDAARDHVTPDFGVLSITTFGACVPTMLAHASPDFLARHVPRVLRGEELWCQFFSEPEAGSDLAGIHTRASRADDGWRLTGSKIWSSLAHLADFGMCLARSNWDVPKHRGLTWFAVDCASPGLDIRQIRQIAGNLDFCEAFLDDVAVPDAERIGEVDQGWQVTGTLLVFERGAATPATAGLSDAPGPLPRDLIDLARRVGRLDDPAVQQQIVAAHVDDYVVSQLKNHLVELAQTEEMNPGVAAHRKLAVAAASLARSEIARSIGGAAAVLWEADDVQAGSLAQGFLEAKKPAIAGGTEQMQRNAVAEQVLGLPREPSIDTKLPFVEVLKAAKGWPR
jgi:alkylation response protein AidB-like acyl-CoA dehydrogenase